MPTLEVVPTIKHDTTRGMRRDSMGELEALEEGESLAVCPFDYDYNF